MDTAIMYHLDETYRLQVGERTAERLRQEVQKATEKGDENANVSGLPKGKKARAAKASHMGQQGFLLLEWIRSDKPLLSSLPSVEILQRVRAEQFEPAEPGELPDLKEMRGRSPAGRVESPYDIDARYRTRRSTRCAGYIVHLSETCDPDLPHALTTTADVHEAKSV